MPSGKYQIKLDVDQTKVLETVLLRARCEMRRTDVREQGALNTGATVASTEPTSTPLKRGDHKGSDRVVARCLTVDRCTNVDLRKICGSPENGRIHCDELGSFNDLNGYNGTDNIADR